MLLEARDKETGAPMSERELIDEAMTLIVAGHETTASGLNWTWYLLSQNPEAEARLHAEIDAAAEQGRARPRGHGALAYTKNVVDEALRLYPPGWMLSRRTIDAGHAAAATTCRPAPTCCCASIYCTAIRATGRSPKPSGPSASMRRTKPNVRVSPTCRSPPGPRHCIGETLALYEMYMHLYKVARRYRLRYVPTGRSSSKRRSTCAPNIL